MKTGISGIILIFLSLFILVPADYGYAGRQDICLISISADINPGVADFLKSGIKFAGDNGFACIIIKLNTPGGLSESMREMIVDILASKLPVIVYVAPDGARAASAGVMITIAADIAAMAPGTNIGAAHPVGIGGKDTGGTMSDKITNDMAAFARSIAAKRQRNVEWAENAVRKSVSITETEALKQNVIDLVAKDLDELITKINGRKIKDKGVLQLDGYKITEYKETLRTKILNIIGNPNISYVLMMIGLAGLYFEMAHPGVVFPGVIGGISLILAFYSFQVLPINYAGVLLIVLAVVFFILEMKITSYGLLSVAGVTSFLLGSLMLFEGSVPGVRISMDVLLPTVVFVSLFFVAVSALVFKAQILKSMSGSEALIGETGIVKKDIMPEGKIFVHGELWKARSIMPLTVGTKVKVIKVDNLVLEVEQINK
ncbi:NfeD family protein [Desulfobacterium sp. N47]|uniref:NfeD family protein n=1 Tax=Desulfobacterium sp. N47 TaxID=3115210 RepID=UPI003C855465